MLLNIIKRMRGVPRPNQPETTHNCLKTVLTVAEFLGVFPLDNIRAENHLSLRFKLCSWKVLYTGLLGFSYLFCAAFSTYKGSTAGILLNQLISPLFYVHSFLTVIFFVKIASDWPKFMLQWVHTEEIVMKRYKNNNLKKKVNLLFILMVVVTLLEHFFSMLNHVYSKKCNNNSSGAEFLFKKQSHFIFTYMPYHFILGLILMIISWIATFVWNFADIFIILISLIVAERYKQINKKIESYVEDLNLSAKSFENTGHFIKVYNSEEAKSNSRFWAEIRQDYNQMNRMVEYLDKLLSNIVVLSYACNLTFILVQLFNSLRELESFSEGLYFYYSFGYVITRIVIVSIFGASINENSMAGLPFLHTIPTEMFNEEIQRLITQMHIDCAALTGHNFFRITKGLVLSVAAAIITYELVLIQFNQASIGANSPNTTTICI